ncbi:MAG: DNA topoisomerase, partial [Paeniclostridium sordellii]|nr:DNA topoisomerase [Paeniclostridium sordellii]
EEIVYKAIKDRFIANFMPPAEYENTEMHTYVYDHKFLTKGKVLKVKGFLEVYNKEEKDDLLPFVNKDDIVDVVKMDILTKQTTPPKSYTEDTLLKAMKNCGKNVSDDDTAVLSGYSIGTSATRAEVLKKIAEVGYVHKKGKSYYITDLGKNLVEIFPLKDLLDVDYTGKLEKSLSDIQRGEFTRSQYLTNIMSFIVNGVETIKNDTNKNISTEVYSYNPKTKRYSKGTFSSDGSKQESLGVCPICKNDVIECSKGYICTNYKECKFGIWNTDKFLLTLKKKPNKTMVKSILKNGFAKVKGLTSKSGNKFDAILKYTKKDNGYFSWDMEFEKKEDSK